MQGLLYGLLCHKLPQGFEGEIVAKFNEFKAANKFYRSSG